MFRFFRIGFSKDTVYYLTLTHIELFGVQYLLLMYAVVVLLKLSVWTCRGESDKRAVAFREKFASIGDFRTVSTDTCFIAMTATATKLVETRVASMLQMNDYQSVRQSPEKPNIRYVYSIARLSKMSFRNIVLNYFVYRPVDSLLKQISRVFQFMPHFYFHYCCHLMFVCAIYSFCFLF